MMTIMASDIHDMIRHWLGTPVNGYLGSDYGSDIKSMLQRSLSSSDANNLIRKLRNDIPVLQSMPSGAINLFSVQSAPDKLSIFLEVAGQTIQVS